jgi:hypothetical protein
MKNYKSLTFILIVVSITITNLSYAQEQDTIPILKTYEDLGSKLFISKVVDVPGKSTPELINRFKNWASLKFVSLKDVIVTETENQIVLVYLTNLNRAYMKIMGKEYPFQVKFYVRMVVQFKNDKLRAQFYDDGNAYVSGGISSRSIYISSFTQMPSDPKDLHKITSKIHGPYYEAHCEWQDNVLLMTKSFEEGMKNDSLNSKKNDFDF